MHQSLNDFLEERQADTQTVLAATRHYLAERTDYLPAEEMRRELLEAARDKGEVNEVLDELENNPTFAEEAAREFLSHAWEDPSQREQIRMAFDAVEDTLPVVEAAIIAIVGMYGMYLVATGGVAEEEVETETKPDGTTKKRAKRKYHSPTGPLSKITNLFP